MSEKDNSMKKYLLVIGTLVTTLALLGCSGTPENSTALAPGQGSTSSVGLNANAETVRIGSIDWYVNYDDALADAKQTNRPVWLHFGENPG